MPSVARRAASHVPTCPDGAKAPARSLSRKVNSGMKCPRHLAALSLLVVVACLAPLAHAFERVRAGEWSAMTMVGGRTLQNSQCLSQRDAEALNGDAQAVRVYLEKVVAPTLCKIMEVRAEGDRIVYTAACGSSAPNVVTTTYHGTSFEASASAGTRTEAKWVGPCR
jgi:hypothetical protein